MNSPSPEPIIGHHCVVLLPGPTGTLPARGRLLLEEPSCREFVQRCDSKLLRLGWPEGRLMALLDGVTPSKEQVPTLVASTVYQVALVEAFVRRYGHPLAIFAAGPAQIGAQWAAGALSMNGALTLAITLGQALGAQSPLPWGEWYRALAETEIVNANVRVMTPNSPRRALTDAGDLRNELQQGVTSGVELSKIAERLTGNPQIQALLSIGAETPATLELSEPADLDRIDLQRGRRLFCAPEILSPALLDWLADQFPQSDRDDLGSVAAIPFALHQLRDHFRLMTPLGLRLQLHETPLRAVESVRVGAAVISSSRREVRLRLVIVDQDEQRLGHGELSLVAQTSESRIPYSEREIGTANDPCLELRRLFPGDSTACDLLLLLTSGLRKLLPRKHGRLRNIEICSLALARANRRPGEPLFGEGSTFKSLTAPEPGLARALECCSESLDNSPVDDQSGQGLSAVEWSEDGTQSVVYGDALPTLWIRVG